MKWSRVLGVAGKVLGLGVKAQFIRAHLPLWIGHLICTFLAFLFLIISLFVPEPRAMAIMLGLAAVAMFAAVLLSIAMAWIMIAAFLEGKL